MMGKERERDVVRTKVTDETTACIAECEGETPKEPLQCV